MAGNRKRLKKALGAVVIISIAVLAAAYFLSLKKVKALDYVETTGVIEATEVDLSTEVSGRLSWLCCEEGARVARGSEVIRLDDRELSARVVEGGAALKTATDALSEARIGLENAESAALAAGYETRVAEAEVQRAAALYKNSRAELKRGLSLYKEGFVTRSRLDSLKADYDASAAVLRSARARAQSAGAQARTAEVNIKAARARVVSAGARGKEAEASLDVLNAGLEKTVIKTPITGVVSYKAFETGETVNPGEPVYTLYDDHQVWARVDIQETLIQSIRLGARAEVWPEAAPGRKFSATVSEIGTLAGFATLKDVTRGRSDIRTFRVKALVAKPDGVLKPGMTVRVRIYFSGK